MIKNAKPLVLTLITLTGVCVNCGMKLQLKAQGNAASQAQSCRSAESTGVISGRRGRAQSCPSPFPLQSVKCQQLGEVPFSLCLCLNRFLPLSSASALCENPVRARRGRFPRLLLQVEAEPVPEAALGAWPRDETPVSWLSLLSPHRTEGQTPSPAQHSPSFPGQSSCSRGDLIPWEMDGAEPLIPSSLDLMCLQQQRLSQKQNPAQGPGAKNQLCGVLCPALDQPAGKGWNDNPSLTWP